MDKILFYLFIVFEWIKYLSITGSIVICIIIVLKKVAKDRLGVEFQYALCILIFLRLIFPVMPRCFFSVFNFTPFTECKPIMFSELHNRNYTEIYTEDLKKDIQIFIDKQAADNKKHEADMHTKNYFYESLKNFDMHIKIPFLIWLCGLMIITIYTVIVNIKFSNMIKGERKVENEYILEILRQCKNDMCTKKNILLLEIQGIKSPAIFRVVHTKILLPLHIINDVNENDLKNIFLHELAHYKRKDIIVNYLFKIICVLYWFNPLVWYMFHKMKQDRELCCDTLVFTYLKEDEVKNYGYTIIKLIERGMKFPKIDMSLGMNGTKEIFRRINTIKNFKQRTYKEKAMPIIFSIVCAVFLLTETQAGYAVSSKIDAKHIINAHGIMEKVDNINYSFENDSNLFGKWTVVDFVRRISDFTVEPQSYKQELYLKEIIFKEKGKTNFECYTWTKGIIVNNVDKTAGEYFIKKIMGENYMFLQWKSGDYAYRNRFPRYYVLKKMEER